MKAIKNTTVIILLVSQVHMARSSCGSVRYFSCGPYAHSMRLLGQALRRRSLGPLMVRWTRIPAGPLPQRTLTEKRPENDTSAIDNTRLFDLTFLNRLQIRNDGADVIALEREFGHIRMAGDDALPRGFLQRLDRVAP